MNKAWKSLDLEGGGLQTINQALTARMKHHRAAYALWLLFPLGLHRFYLQQFAPGVFLILLADALALFGGMLFSMLPGWVFLLPLLAVGIYEAIWIDRRVSAYNKELRMKLYLRHDHAPPAHYQGRVIDNEQLIESFQQEKEQETVGGTAKAAAPTLGKQHILSFAEQEKLLREMKKPRDHR
ncbi:MAG: TM2 domain-containing protein [Gammaproteobacteria bacterium]|nr:TM2 domain-containing protein [Gammaproteobacteria bacterium]